MWLFVLSIVLLVAQEVYSDPTNTSQNICGQRNTTAPRKRKLLPSSGEWVNCFELDTAKERKLPNGMVYNTYVYSTSNPQDYRVYFKKENEFLSPFHDIPLYHDEGNKILNMIVEIPRGTRKKMEIATKEKLNPIKQDVNKDGTLREISVDYVANYGAFPQTWESPKKKDKHLNQFGDNDPIDVVEIGSRVANLGDVIKVKVIGILGLIDEGETDWKVVVIDINDPQADKINTKEDIETHYGDRNENKIVKWFKEYKLPETNKLNQVAYDDKIMDSTFAMEVIDEVNTYWKELHKTKENNTENLACENISVEDSPYKSTSSEILDKIPHLKSLRAEGKI